jgi:hypothetical protein
MKELQEALKAVYGVSDGNVDPKLVIGRDTVELDFGQYAVTVADTEEAITQCAGVNAAFRQLWFHEAETRRMDGVYETTDADYEGRPAF